MDRLIKFAALKDVFTSEKKIKAALDKKKVPEDVVTCFTYAVRNKRRVIEQSFVETLKEDPQLTAVAKKHTMMSKEYKAASAKTAKNIPVELVLNSGKPGLMVGRTVCV